MAATAIMKFSNFIRFTPSSLRNEVGLCAPAKTSSANRWVIGEVKLVALPQQRRRTHAAYLSAWMNIS
jgi:hypothetical protein